jgi:hypothetical protein
VKLKHTTLGNIPTVSLTDVTTGTGLKSAREPSGATGVENERGGPEVRFLGLVRAVGAVELPGWVG